MSGKPSKENSKNTNTSNESSSATVFPVGPAGKRELRRALVRARDPVNTITTFQQAHSLHSMMARAFHTIPIHTYKNTRHSTHGTVESLDSDSVMTFLTHLGVRQHEVHKRISDTLLKQLETEIRKTTAAEPLLELLKQCWAYATTLPELRPVLWGVLKQLGPQTPVPVLIALAEREKDSSTGKMILKHSEIFRPLPASFKRLTWEAEWENQTTIDPISQPEQYNKKVQSTLFFETISPWIHLYVNNKILVDAADRAFAATVGERKVLTTQRRALTKSSASGSAVTTTASLLRQGKDSQPNTLNVQIENESGRAVSQLRSLMCDTVGSASSYRPKLLYAVLSILMARHGGARIDFSPESIGEKPSVDDKKEKNINPLSASSPSLLGGAHFLHCTLVADLLLSAGGPLPKAYTHVLAFARTLDDCVQEGNVTDSNVIKLQSYIKLIFQPESVSKDDDEGEKKKTSSKLDDDNGNIDETNSAHTSSVKRHLNKLIKAGLDDMKEADPQHLFLNPVTDAIAPGYSKIISRPMCITTMEEKVSRNEYKSVIDWEADVKLMFKNCIDYNRGIAGQWFRGEANRQRKVFREEIYPNIRRKFQTEMIKEAATGDKGSKGGSGIALNSNGKRAGDSSESISPLPPSSKKRKKEKEEYIPSMPALASMLLADPFVVRIFLARILRELRRGVMAGNSLPVCHGVIPSLLQMLHLSGLSNQVCAIRGKKYVVPPVGFNLDDDDLGDTVARVPYVSLRRCLPILMRLLLEAELDNRTSPGGDLHEAGRTVPFKLPRITVHAWEGGKNMHVAVSLLEGSLVHICQPGNGNESSLSISFPKFAVALSYASASLLSDRIFFRCLINALLRHKAKLSKETRDAVINSWLQWLRPNDNNMPGDDTHPPIGAMTSAAHECLIQLMNEWCALGNVVLPRDKVFKFSIQAVQAADASEKDENRKFVTIWNAEDAEEFTLVKKQYERMLNHMPETSQQQWKEQIGLTGISEQPEEENDQSDVSPEQQRSPMDSSPLHLPSPTGSDGSPDYPSSPM